MVSSELTRKSCVLFYTRTVGWREGRRERGKKRGREKERGREGEREREREREPEPVSEKERAYLFRHTNTYM